jgi:flagellin
MRIQHNIMAMSAYRNYTNNVSAMKKNLEKLSSGYKINRAGDDAAGLAISEKMRAQITGLETAQKNAKDGISLVQTAEGALTEVHDMLNRMVELATQSANGTYDNTTDRAQMQKEVNQLLEEIDRIADSSNFNGINLLDGSLGLNTDAFSISAGDAYTAAVDVTTTDLTPENPHGGQSVAAAPASFTVNLKELEGNIATGATNKLTFTLNIAGQDVTASIAGSTTSKAVTASDVAGAIAAKYTGAAASSSIKIGDVYFKATNTGGELTFSMVGYDKGGTFTAATGATGAAELSEDQVKALNTALAAAKVSVKATAAGTATWANVNNVDHGITPTLGVAKVEGGLLGAEYDITNLLADGAQLKLQNKTFTVHLGTDATTTNSSALDDIYIDTNKYTTKEAQMERLKEVLTAKSTANFNINTAAGNKISVDQNASGAITGVKTMADVTAQIVSPAQDEKLASTKLTIDEGKLKEGNVISVGDKKFVYKGSGSNGFTDAADLASKLTTAGYTTAVSTDASGKKVLNIQGKQAAGVEAKDVAAPMVLGKGLTLQIGDTSDDFNQLNVAVQDMHAANLGIGNLDISTEEAAQAAIKNIKAAINTVSDVRGTLGATQNRLDHTINNLSVMTENIQDAESTIRDVDVAEEMMAYTKNNILIQSAQAMLAQANQVPQGVLQLLQ